MSLDLRGLCPLLQVFDMHRSLDFYCGLLGFEIVQSAPSPDAPDWCWLRRGEIELMLNTRYEAAHRPAEAEPARQAAHDDTCLYLGCPDPDAAWNYLRERGLELAPPVTQRYGMRQLYLHDPDGFAICLQWRAQN